MRASAINIRLRLHSRRQARFLHNAADSLYEAVALAVARFRRDNGWAMCPPGPGCEFRVKVLPDSPVIYSIPLNKVEKFALHGTVAGPQDILRKERIRQLLGLDAAR